VVEDDEDIQQLVTYNLVRKNYRVSCAMEGRQALDLVRVNNFDLILLDLMLPGFDGLEICKLLRKDPASRDIPIIIVTARGEETDVVKGLECGADDYMTKPFSPNVLLARIKTILRRRSEEQKESARKDLLQIYEITIDLDRHEVMVEEEPVTLTVSEFNILRFLAAHPGRVYTRQQIIDNIRGYDHFITSRTVDVHVFGLRKKLGVAGRYIETIRGIGYRFLESPP
jgi:two-component system phosphate regulon response regulator PhoB